MKTLTRLFILPLLIISTGLMAQPKLNSFPSATATIFIDFDGHTVIGSSWNNGNRLDCQPALLNDAQKTEIFNRVAEDYRPFNVNITTDSTKFLSAPLNRRIRIIVTPTSSWTYGVGGIAYIGSFVWGDDTPAFVFSDRLNNSPKYIGECVTHESGHTVGLAHQSAWDNNCNLVEQYAQGSGSGETGWAPVMGNSYYKNMTGWNDGPTPYGCSNTQDNLTIITSQNGFTYRADDHSNSIDASATELNPNSFSQEGIISTNTDKDAFKYIISQNSSIHFEFTPFGLNSANAGANLDIEVKIYNTSGALINTYNPYNKMNVVIDTSLNAGTYYFVVAGGANNNTDGYGSLGSYFVTGFRGALPIREVALSGTTQGDSHSFSWNIIADEPIRSQQLEVSADGSTFRMVTDITAGTNTASYIPQGSGMLYYRLKVISVIDETAYSNTVALRANGKGKFTVSTFVTSQININAGESFEYIILDVNGKLLQKGKGNAGFNSIDFNKASGMYVIRLISKNSSQTERIIKQ